MLRTKEVDKGFPRGTKLVAFFCIKVIGVFLNHNGFTNESG